MLHSLLSRLPRLEEFVLSYGTIWNIFSACFILLVTVIYVRSWWRRLYPTAPTGPSSTAQLRRRVLRVTGLPAFSDNKLNDILKTAIYKLLGEANQSAAPISTILPSCYDNEQERIALVEFHGVVPSFLSNPLGEWQVQVGDIDVSFDQHFFGFTQLYTQSSEKLVTADIIAITGLDGHAYGSWRSKGDLGRMWLRDFLAKDLPCCRTMIYGYNSKLSSRGIDAIMDYGRELMEELKKIRNTDELRRRPIFFVAHSFGGLILAHCLIKAVQTNEDSQPTIASLHKATYGMILFGIPHKGLVVDDIQKMLAGQDNHPRNRLLKQISEKSDLLASQLADFKNLIHDRKIVSFYETGQARQLEFDTVSKLWKRTGDFFTPLGQESALLELPDSMEEKIPLASDHSMMVKFNAASNKGYTSARDKLIQFEKDAPRVVEARFSQSLGRSTIPPPSENTSQIHPGSGYNIWGSNAQVPIINTITRDAYFNTGTSSDGDQCLRDLFVTDPLEDREAMKRKKGERAQGTCEWIMETGELIAWLGSSRTGLSETQASHALWLHGNPGTGKSTMAMYLTEALGEKFSAAHGHTLAFFFCDSSFGTRRTASSVIRSLLLQLIQQHPSLINYVLPKYALRNTELFESFDALWEIFISAAADTHTGRKYCIIDALDECDQDSQKLLLYQLRRTFQCSEAQQNLRILVISRPYSEINEYLELFPNKDLASFPEAEQDINVFIEERVTELAGRKRYTTKVITQVRNILKDKAEGKFLWVGIACEELQEISSRNAISHLETMPGGLFALYEKLLGSALEHENEKDTIRLVLSFIAVSQWPLNLLELSEICGLFLEEDDPKTRAQFMRDLIGSCRLLVVIRNRRVVLLHQSVKEYLLKADQKTAFAELQAHANLAYHCLDHLIRRFHGSGETRRYFSNYAITEWPNHARMAKTNFEVLSVHAEFFETGSQAMKNWFNLYRHTKYFGRQEIPEQFSMLHVAARWGIPAIAKYFSASCAHHHISEGLIHRSDSSGMTPIAYAVRSNYTSIVPILLELGAKVTHRVMVRAADQGKEVMALLLQQQRDDIAITEEIMTTAARNRQNSKEMMELLLDRRGSEITITEDVVKAAAGNEYDGKEVMTLLLDQRGGEITITEDVVKAAAGNEYNGKKVMTLLLDRRGSEITITEDVVKAAAGNEYDGGEVMTLLLDRRGGEITITEDVVMAAAKCDSKEVMAILLDRRWGEVTITEDTVKAAVRGSNARDIMALLLNRRGGEVPITEEVVKAAAEGFNARDVMELLLNQRGGGVIITEEVVKAAAEGFNARDIIALLLDRRGGEVIITEEVVKAAVRGFNARDIMALLLDQRGGEVIITEEVVKAAVRGFNARDIIALLLDRRGGEIPITEEVVKAAVRGFNARDIMALLLDQRGGKVPITEEVVKAAVRGSNARDIMALLLDQRGGKVPITEEVVKAAVRGSNARDIMALLLDQRGGEVIITEEVVKAAAGGYNARDIMALLLDRQGGKVIITEEVVKAAAGGYNARDIMELLLNWRGGEIPITEDVVKAAAGNKHSGGKVIEFLLDQRKEETTIAITDTILFAAATCGQLELLEFLSRRDSLISVSVSDEYRRIAKFYRAAKVGDIRDIEQLLCEGINPDLKNLRGETPLWVAAMGWHEAVVKILAQRSDVNINSLSKSGRSPLFWAASVGSKQIVAILLEAGANPDLVDEGGNTAFTVARKNRHWAVVKLLEDHKKKF
ncbi:hypothetical protein QQS21_000329 [Conoideocrella luteorostrata]|uniref:Nephrocystin 3-like N-terminal domain-containing protein n=1 Tax=Conoideocrella luteorostrata TaxID=1105319 RepID=A0AAJ0G2L8_9HYPO|nr:hypothetical protein QQS21_000329 [Conoideocrella luteorostrata]